MSFFRVLNILWIIITLCAMSQGCGGKPDAKPVQEQAEVSPEYDPNALILEIGGGASITLVFIEVMDLFVGKFEVTNAEYRRFKPNHSSGDYKGLSLDDDAQPVVNVSWNDAMAFCKWLNDEFEVVEDIRFLFRLPKEEEWETFASCGDYREYPWGDFWPPPNDWNYFGLENSGVGGKVEVNDGYIVSSPVFDSGVNEWGLYGVGGNVWEWCDSPGDIEGKTRVMKGASWVDYHTLFMTIDRKRVYQPDYRAVNMGFRLVADIRDATTQEIEEFAAHRRAVREKLEAEQARVDSAAAKVEAERKDQEDRVRRDSLAKAQGEIRMALFDKDFDLVAKHLVAYDSEFGQDEFYKNTSLVIANTKLIKLADVAILEFVRNQGFNGWVGKHEVSNRQYKQFRKDHESGSFRGRSLDGDGQPVVQVSWNDAKSFCEWLNSKFADKLDSGYEFRLPTEEEWESFASCGDGRDFPWGNDWPPLYGNFGSIDGYDDGFEVSAPVEDSGMNEWGLYGVGGNVWEWCEDQFDSGDSYRVIKGGAWNLARPDALRVTNKNGDSLNQRNSFIGFRVIIGPKL